MSYTTIANQDSVYNHKLNEFKDYFRQIDYKSTTVSDALVSFRESSCLPDEYKRMTCTELSDNPKLILQLREDLRNRMAPPGRLKISRKQKEFRQRELIDNLAEYNKSIDKERTICNIITGRYDDGERTYNYTVEVIAAPLKHSNLDDAGKVEIIGNINSSPAIDGGEHYFENGYYVWTDKRGNTHKESSVRGILSTCGFNEYTYVSRKRRKSVVFVNVKTPVIDWLGSAGKTHLDTKAFQDDLAKAISSAAYKIDTYHGHGYRSEPLPIDDAKDKDAIEYLRVFIMEREQSAKKNDPLTQSGVFYRLRPKMIAEGFQPDKNWQATRRYITSRIDEECRLIHGCEREDLGIYAKARGMLMFDRQIYPVDIDSIQYLASKGIAIIVIEKEGVPAVLEPYARESGITLLHTGGRFTKYVKQLIEAAKNGSSIVVTLTDDDDYGYEISSATFTKTPRIGLDRHEALAWFRQNGYPDLTMADLEEEYIINGIEKTRVELDSLIAIVGAKDFWKYVVYRLQLEAPKGFDYNRVIDMPAKERFYPEGLADFQSCINEYFDGVLEDEQNAIEDELTGITSLININSREDEIYNRLNKIVSQDDGVELIDNKAKELLNQLRELQSH